MTAYRKSGTIFVEPPPYLNPNTDCPFCHGCPNLLYFHQSWCYWWRAYVKAGRKMRPRFSKYRTQEYVYNHAPGEVDAVLAIAPMCGAKDKRWWVKLLEFLCLGSFICFLCKDTYYTCTLFLGHSDNHSAEKKHHICHQWPQVQGAKNEPQQSRVRQVRVGRARYWFR